MMPLKRSFLLPPPPPSTRASGGACLQVREGCEWRLLVIGTRDMRYGGVLTKRQAGSLRFFFLFASIDSQPLSLSFCRPQENTLYQL